MKKILWVVMLILMVSCLFAAGQAEAGKPSDQPVTIRFWFNGDVGTVQYENMLETVELFNVENAGMINVEVTFSPNADQYLNKLTTEMAANNTPDIFLTWTSERLAPFVQAGRIEPLDDIIDNSEILTDNVNKGNCSSATFDNVIYAIPMYLTGEVIYYNKAIFAQNGLDVPENWDDMKNIIKVLNENEIIPFGLGNKDPWPGTIPYMSIFDRVNGPDAYKSAIFNKTAEFNTEPFVKAAEYLQELVELGAYPSNFNSLDYSEGLALFTGGKAAMRYNGIWETPGNIDALGDDLGVITWPTMPEGRSQTGYPVAQNTAWAIGANSKHKEEAAKFLEFAMSDARMSLLAEEGLNIAAQNIPFDASKMHPISSYIISELADTPNPILIWDVMLGQNIGKELNLATQAILGGADIEETLDAFNRMAELEWK